jgi:hypothetical protein
VENSNTFHQIHLVFDVLTMQVCFMLLKYNSLFYASPVARIAVLTERNTLDAALFNYHGNYRISCCKEAGQDDYMSQIN